MTVTKKKNGSVPKMLRNTGVKWNKNESFSSNSRGLLSYRVYLWLTNISLDMAKVIFGFY